MHGVGQISCRQRASAYRSVKIPEQSKRAEQQSLVERLLLRKTHVRARQLRFTVRGAALRVCSCPEAVLHTKRMLRSAVVLLTS